MKSWVPTFENWFNGTDHIDEVYTQCCVFGRTLYRVPTNEELKNFEKYPEITAKDVLNEFYYIAVGKGILRQQEKNLIKESISKLIALYPKNKKFKDALVLADELKLFRPKI